MSNTNPFITHIRDLIAKDEVKTAIQALSALLKDSPRLDEAVQQSARYSRVIQQIRLGLVGFQDADITQNQIGFDVLELLREIEEQEQMQPSIKAEVERHAVKFEKNVVRNSIINAGVNLTIGDTMITTQQNHSGSGDNVSNNKIGRQINMGEKSTYIEKQTSQKEITTEKAVTEPAPKTQEGVSNPNLKPPETPSGFLGLLFSSIPKPINWVIAILVLGFASFLAYQYFIPKKVETPQSVLPTPANEKVYVSGKIYINNGEPKLNEITRLTLRNIDANSAQISSTGQFTFENIKIPDNKRLLVNITFSDGKTIPTEELIVGDTDIETKTVRLPDLYITRPLPAKGGKPVTGWKIQVNINNGNGELKANQN